MFTTFDRYLLARMLHTFVVMFVAAYGLYIVIDLFTNIDSFQENTASTMELVARIGEFYAWRAFDFFEMTGPILIVIAVIAVLGLLQKNSETFPILAAGIPAFRLLRPLLIAAAIGCARGLDGDALEDGGVADGGAGEAGPGGGGGTPGGGAPEVGFVELGMIDHAPAVGSVNNVQPAIGRLQHDRVGVRVPAGGEVERPGPRLAAIA